MESVLNDRFRGVFGRSEDSMELIERRAREAFPDRRIIVWEGDPQTFAFSYVGGDADDILGYPSSDWIRDSAFWTNQVVHPDDRDEAIAFCALATGKGCDHIFEYRARTTSGNIVWLQDYVRVVLGNRLVPVKLRGVMIDVTEEKRREGKSDEQPELWLPPAEQLNASGTA